MTTGRRGSSLAELVLVAWLFAFVLAAVARFAGTQGRFSAVQHDLTRGAEAVRVASLITESELRYLAPADLGPATTERIPLRAFRGGGTICRSEGDDLLVRYRGVRLPNPAKDSVVLVTAHEPQGSPSVALTAVAVDDACGGALRLTVESAPTPTRGLVLVYERGSYHLSEGAFRYRVGDGGRQPLTETLFAGVGFDASDPADGLSLRLELHADSLPRLGTLRYDLRLRPLNASPP